MAKLGRCLGPMLLAAAALAGCMSGRASLLATQGRQGAASQGLTRSSITPAAMGMAPGQVQASGNLMAPTPSAGTARAPGGLAARAGQLVAAGRTSLAITPTLAPASSVGASVAAVSQPLNVAATAQASVRTGSATAVKSTVKLKAAGIGVAVRLGP